MTSGVEDISFYRLVDAKSYQILGIEKILLWYSYSLAGYMGQSLAGSNIQVSGGTIWRSSSGSTPQSRSSAIFRQL